MNATLALILIVFTFLSARTSSAVGSDLTAGPEGFCLQSFNAYGPFYAGSIQKRTDQILGFLRTRPTCEVVQLQEVWMESQTIPIIRSLEDLFAISAPNLRYKIGLMTLTQGPQQETVTYLFKKNDQGGVLDKIRKGLKIAKAFHSVRFRPVATSEDFWFTNLHLHPSSQALRISQLLEILNWRLKNQDSKWLLSGDFNADLDSLERQLIVDLLGASDGLEMAWKGYPPFHCTYCSSNQRSWLNRSTTFDYIFFSNVGGRASSKLLPIQGEVNMHGSKASSWSDHFGIRVHFQFRVAPELSALESVAILNTKKTRVLEVLSQIESILQKKSESFLEELEQIQTLREELQQEQGLFWDYLDAGK